MEVACVKLVAKGNAVLHWNLLVTALPPLPVVYIADVDLSENPSRGSETVKRETRLLTFQVKAEPFELWAAAVRHSSEFN